MKFRSKNRDIDLELGACPFCASDPVIKYIGNEYVKRRSIEVSCPSCRIKRTDAALRHGFDFLEDAAVKNWNQRPDDGCNKGEEND